MTTEEGGDTMPRYIDANALISDSRICGNCKDYELCDGNIAFCSNASVRRAINNAPTADVEPVRHGRWTHDMEGCVRCSVCNEHEVNEYAIFFGYCPNCGAKMDGGECDD